MEDATVTVENYRDTGSIAVTKALAGDWADYTDHFIFTLEITDPDADPSRMASVTVSESEPLRSGKK